MIIYTTLPILLAIIRVIINGNQEEYFYYLNYIDSCIPLATFLFIVGSFLMMNYYFGMPKAVKIVYPSFQKNQDGQLFLNGQEEYKPSAGKGGPYGKRTIQFGNDVGFIYEKALVYVYGGMKYYINDDGETIGIGPNQSIVDVFQREDAYSKIVSLGKDPRCPTNYTRGARNIIVDSSCGKCKYVLCIMNPINSSPFTNPPQRQFTVYVSIIPNHDEGITIDDLLWEGSKIHPFKIGTMEAYPIPHCDVLRHRSMLYDINLRLQDILGEIPLVCDSQLNNGKCGRGLILGPQTLETCSVLWMHIHAIIIGNGESLNRLRTSTLDSYMNEDRNKDSKFIR